MHSAVITLPDRGFVYQPNTIKGNKPIVIGRQCSFWAWLPEHDPSQKSNWVVPLSMQRVSSQANKEMVGAQQLGDLLTDKDLPFGETFCVEVADSAYSKPAYLQRYDLEHFFRFGKQKLLLDKFQTPDEKHEEHWWQLVALAYLQLWAAKDMASNLPRPWEQYLPSPVDKQPTGDGVA
jgi:hypothetical protein